MAVEAILSVIVKKMSSFFIHEAALLERLPHESLEFFERTLRDLQGFLKDAEKRQEDDAKIKKWVMDVRDVAFQIEEALEMYIFKKAQENRKGLIKRYTGKIFNDILINYKFNEDLSKIKVKIHDIFIRQSIYCIKNKGSKMNELSSVSAMRRTFSPHGLVVDVVGFEEHLKLLEAKLIGGNLQRSVVSVVGPAGIGKSRLVSELYVRKNIRNHFHGQAWMNVHPDDSDRMILLRLAKELSLSDPILSRLDIEGLLRLFNAVLKEERLLLVIDGFSTSKSLEILKAALPDTETGSRIIFIARHETIASDIDSSESEYPFTLQPLNDNHSWQLFIQMVSKACQTEISTTHILLLEQFKRQILQICSGLPLAVSLLSDLISRKGLEFLRQLSKMCKPINVQIDRGHHTLHQLMEMCYNELPTLLKLCFLYTGIFPVHSVISARRLVQLWISEGFVWDQDDKVAEEIADKYLEELVDRSLLRVLQRRRNGTIKGICYMVPIWREFIVLKSKEVQLFDYHHLADPNCFPSSSIGCIHRYVLHSDVQAISFGHCNKLNLHSLVSFGLVGDGSTILSGDVSNRREFRMLKVIDLSYTFVQRVPEELGELLLLRHLGLRKTEADVNPLALCSLKNLRTLDLKGTKSQARFPRDLIAEMQQLRHLYVDAYYMSDTFYPPEYRLQVLNPPRWKEGSYQERIMQTIWRLGIDKNSQVKDGWDRYRNLKKLGLVGDFESQLEAITSWISKLHHLESLTMENINFVDFKKPTAKYILFSTPLKHTHINLHKLVLSSFWIENLPEPDDFPPNLSCLNLGACALEENPLHKLGKLPNLSSLVISSCKWPQIRELVSSAYAFPKLEFLHLHFLKNLEEWTVEEGAFPNLQRLTLGYCDKLKMIPDGFRHVSSLKQLDISSMPWEFKSRVKEDTGEDWNRVAHILKIITKEHQ